MAPITINGNTLDPEQHQHLMRVFQVEQPDAKNSEYILIQGRGPLSVDQQREIEALGPKILEYVSKGTYLCRYNPPDLSAIRNKPFVAWANVYPTQFVVPPKLKGDTPSHAENVRALAPAAPTSKKRDLFVCLHNDRTTSSPGLRAKVAQAAHVPEHNVHDGGNKFRVLTEERFMDELAAIDAVYFLDEVEPMGVHNERAVDVLSANNVSGSYAHPEVLLQGKHEVVAVGDTGFDLGLTDKTHPAFTGRVLKLYPSTRVKLTPKDQKETSADDPVGHGTHVCGSVLGNQTVTTAKGALTIHGTAPQAKLVVQSLHGGFYVDRGKVKSIFAVPDDLYNFFQEPYRADEARVHTNSWGPTNPTGKYTARARDVDKFVNDNQDMVILFSAGNSGQDAGNGFITLDAVSGGALGKNCITVGASENNRPDVNWTYGQDDEDWKNEVIKRTKVAAAPLAVAAFSSRGPGPVSAANYGVRVKPDVVAPGTAILSTKAQKITDEEELKFMAMQVFGPPPSPEYWFLSGTSMATPLVAGCCAQLREGLRLDPATGQHKPEIVPSAALVKALLINGATWPTVDQFHDSKPLSTPNPNSGWGRVDVRTATQAMMKGPAYSSYHDHPSPGLDATGRWSVTIDIPNSFDSGLYVPGRPGSGQVQKNLKHRPTMRVTLVWSDPPGKPDPGDSFPADRFTLQNQLGLSVKMGNDERHGNKAPGDKTFDGANNVQQVVWTQIPAGKVELSVTAIHFFSPSSTQRFAVVWTLFPDIQDVP